MACNLPVITTRFGALPIIFEEGDGLLFAESEREFRNAIENIKDGVEVKTREKVLSYSWNNIVGRLEEVYAKLIKEKG